MARYVRTSVLAVLIFVQVFTIVQCGVTRTDSRLRDAFKDALQSYMCVGTNARMCSGNGECRNGACTCNPGYSGSKCEISLSTEPQRETTTAGIVRKPESESLDVNVCSPNDAIVCSGHGICLAGGRCECEPTWSGSLCEVSVREGFCKAYQDCAECTALLQQCPESCQIRARFVLVYGFPTGTSFHRCRQRNIPRNCTFYYQLTHEYSNGRKEIQVRACITEPVAGITTTTASGTPDDEDNKQGDKDSKKGGPGSGVAETHGDLLVILGVVLLYKGVAISFAPL